MCASGHDNIITAQCVCMRVRVFITLEAQDKIGGEHYLWVLDVDLYSGED